MSRRGGGQRPSIMNRSLGPYSKHNYKNMLPKKTYFSDNLILTRVTQYLQGNMGSNHGRPIDFDDMVDELQRNHQEYRRKKRQAFKHQLKKAVDVICFSSPVLAVNDDDDEETPEEDGDELMDVRGRKSPSYAFEGDGDVNAALVDSYLQRREKIRREVESPTQELISIVTSDEETKEDVLAKATEEKTSVPLPLIPVKNSIPEDVSATPSASARPLAEPKSCRKRRSDALHIGSKRFKSSLEPVHPTVSFKSVGGSEKVLQEVTQLLIHMRHPEVYRVLGVSPPRGFLLHGPPGSGKTLLAHAISGELKIPLLKVAAPELVGGLSGQSEERIRELFEQAVALAPCILFIDEVDAITPNRETAHREMERRIVAQLLSSMDELSNNENGDQVLVIGATNRPDSLDPALRRAGRFDREVCLGIPDRQSRMSILLTLCQALKLDPTLQLGQVALMTPGYVAADLKALVTESAMAAVNRLFKTLKEPKEKDQKNVKPPSVEDPSKEELPVQSVEKMETIPSPEVEEDVVVMEQEDTTDTVTATAAEQAEDQPQEVLAVAEKSKTDDGDVQVVPLDIDDTNDDVQVLKVQITTSSPSLLHSPPLSVEQLQGVYITMDDFQMALKTVQPSAKREGFATVPDVKWKDIGSLQDIRQDLKMAILAPVKYPEEFAKMGLHTPTGVLLCGPPGCGKTLLAKAVANEAGINFISVKGPELLNMYVGESERAVRQCFQRARSSQPCVIFFDEIDALCPKRTNMENGASRVVNQLLTEMDGMEARPGVFLMAATNRPDIVDPAVMRPGRLDKVLYVGLPAPDDRVDILRAVTKGGSQPVLGEDVDLAAVAKDNRCNGYTGADLAALVREASMLALQEFMVSEDQCPPAGLRVCNRHFSSALDKIRPSVSDKDKKRYEDLRLQYAAVPSTG